MEEDKIIEKVFPELSLPEEARDIPMPGTKKFTEMESPDGKKVRIIMWDDERVAILATDEKGDVYFSETGEPRPIDFYLAQALYADKGFRITREER